MDGLKGGSLAFSPAEKQLLIVRDAGKRAYRSVPIDGLARLSISGTTYVVQSKD
jgi:hypothetical protein